MVPYSITVFGTFNIIKAHLFMAVIVVSVPPHFEIPWEKIKKFEKKINFETRCGSVSSEE
jgi:hypothetical protein